MRINKLLFVLIVSLLAVGMVYVSAGDIQSLGYLLVGDGQYVLAFPALAAPIEVRFKKSDLKELKLEKEMYKEATTKNLSMAEYISKMELEAGFDPATPAGILTPVERQLMAGGVDVFSSATLVEDFFKTTNSKILFPAYISQLVYMGMGLGKMELNVEDLKASSQKIPSQVIDQIGLDFAKEKVNVVKLSEGSALPTATIKTQEKTSKMVKVGRRMLVSYEAVRRVNIDIMSIFFIRIGYRMGRQMAQDGLRVMLDGDGNSGSASPTSTTATSAVWKYSDLVDLLYNQFNDGHEASHIILSKAMLMKILTDDVNFKQFQSLNLSENFVKTGQIQNFFGCNWKTHAAVPADSILAFEKSTCLSYFEEAGSSIIDSGKIIDQQFNETAISLNFGFAKLFSAASHHRTQKA